ncbi:MAG TPA: protoglobin domain-containing protein [Roseiflexaceae bacterium]|nr:protoglobin domain-containing protein [Roseiflexaceae bacterium]
MAQERKSWQIKDAAILSELVSLMGLSADEAASLGALQGQAREAAPALLDMFYGRLFKHANTAEYLEGVAMERLHTMVAEWFADIFSGTYDQSYAMKRLNIGRVHVRIGLPVRYPLAMLDVIMPVGEDIAKKSAQPEHAVQAFRKVLALDIAIFNQAYEDNQLAHLAELVGGERLARLLLSGQA